MTSAAFTRNKKEKLYREYLDYFGGKKCMFCGNDYCPPNVYEFYPLGGMLKQTIRSRINTLKNIDAEAKADLKKCIVLCANCTAIAKSGEMQQQFVEIWVGKKEERLNGE